MHIIAVGKPSQNRMAKKTSILAVTLLLFVFGCRQSLKPTISDVAGVWFGVSDAAIFVYYLEMQADGKGYFVFSYLDKTKTIYRINDWKLVERGVEFQTAKLRGPEGEIEMKGKVGGDNLQLSIAGPDWIHRVKLYREDVVRSRLELLKEDVRSVRAESEPK